ncbi:MAG: O-antigen ligase family protein [Blastocatellia bacterium]
MKSSVITQASPPAQSFYPNASSQGLRSEWTIVILLVLIHIPLGVLLYERGSISLIHPFSVFLFGMWRALFGSNDLDDVAYVIAYIVGVEVLWRMAGVPVFWEFGKYGSSLIMITALVRRRMLQIPALPLFFFAFLIPSAIMVVLQRGPEDSEGALSSNMSGPFLLLICCWFFSNVNLNVQQVRKLILAIIIPMISIAIAALFYTVTAEDLAFTGESNIATSGGFGPNQVSSILGLGAFLSISYLLLFKNKPFQALFFVVLTLLFSAQSVLTFSRGGMYNAVGATVLVALFQIRNLKDGFRRLAPIVGVSIIFLLVVFPYLDNFTGGALQERFEDSDPTRRGDIIESDFKLFTDHPVFGVGVGNAYFLREKYLGGKAMSHTEFARIISEHGLFGILALVSLVLMVIFNFRQRKAGFDRALMFGFAGWSFFFMLNAGMRLAAPAFALGMVYMTVKDLNGQSSAKPRLENGR